MTITEALSKLRLTDKKVKRLSQKLSFFVEESKNAISISTGSRAVRVKTLQEGLSNITEPYKALTDLMDYRAKLKGKVVQSNAATKVTIGGREMTVAEAIEYKTSIEVKQDIHRSMLSAIATNTRKQDRLQAELADKVDRQVQMVFGNKKNIDAGDNTVKVIEQQIRDAGEVKFHDPLKVSELAQKLGDEIQEFLMNVDNVLTISNSTTTIEV